MELLDGKAVAAFHNILIEKKMTELKAAESIPELAVVLVGDNKPSAMYARFMQKTGRAAGMVVEIYERDGQISETELLHLVDALNDREAIRGILLMMPLPPHMDAHRVINRIRPEKDVDGLTDSNVANLFLGRPGMVPCTPRAVMATLDYYYIDLSGKQVVIIGRSNVVGKPLAQLCLARNATVMHCHSHTADLTALTRQADILISAAGRAKLITGEMVRPGAVVIDVGINRMNGKTVGDVDYDSVAVVAGALTPVPGGIGSVTTTMVMQNVVFGIKASV